MKRALTLIALLAAGFAVAAQDAGATGDAPADVVLPPPTEFLVCPQADTPMACGPGDTAVCGALDNGVRCITTPCENTQWRSFDNACLACAAPGAIGYREGAC